MLSANGKICLQKVHAGPGVSIYLQKGGSGSDQETYKKRFMAADRDYTPCSRLMVDAQFLLNFQQKCSITPKTNLI